MIMLLILGNGFDIQCGLKTDYLDYFSYRYAKEHFNLIIEYFRILELTENFRISQNDDKTLYYINKLIDKSNLKNLFDQISVWDLIFISEKVVKKNAGWHNIENLIFEYISQNKLTLTDIQKYSKNKDTLNRDFDPLLHLVSKLMRLKEMTFSQMDYNK